MFAPLFDDSKVGPTSIFGGTFSLKVGCILCILNESMLDQYWRNTFSAIMFWLKVNSHSKFRRLREHNLLLRHVCHRIVGQVGKRFDVIMLAGFGLALWLHYLGAVCGRSWPVGAF